MDEAYELIERVNRITDGMCYAKNSGLDFSIDAQVNAVSETIQYLEKAKQLLITEKNKQP